MLLAVLDGDGISAEIVPPALAILDAVTGDDPIPRRHAPIGGAAMDAAGDPLPDATLKLARDADAIFLGAVGTPAYEALAKEKPGRGLLRLRRELGLFANLRPVKVFDELRDASPLKPELIGGLDLLIVRELNGDIYYGEPRGRSLTEDGLRQCINTMKYTETEIERIGRVGFEMARQRSGKLCSVDKANVLETMALWREVMTEVGREYPDVELRHLYVDAAAMGLATRPKQFDVIVCGNLFGDILSDEAAVLNGSIGMLPSASIAAGRKGLYEPVHGSAPDIAGQDRANPLGAILSVALMLRTTFDRPAAAQQIDDAVRHVLRSGVRTADIAQAGERVVGTREMGEAVLAAL